MTLKEFNQLPRSKAVERLLKCCGSTRWAGKMADKRPFSSLNELYRRAELIWWDLMPDDWLEAFAQNPKIGDLESLRKRFVDTKEWAGQEQQVINSAPENMLQRLAIGNSRYEKRFGYIFVVYATGKSAGEMLELLEERLQNDLDEEFLNAAGEQNKITKIRLEKLFT